jgi:hypothetical protein
MKWKKGDGGHLPPGTGKKKAAPTKMVRIPSRSHTHLERQFTTTRSVPPERPDVRSLRFPTTAQTGKNLYNPEMIPPPVKWRIA